MPTIQIHDIMTPLPALSYLAVDDDLREGRKHQGRCGGGIGLIGLCVSAPLSDRGLDRGGNNTSIALRSLLISGDYADRRTCGTTIVFKPTTLGVRTGVLTVNMNDTEHTVIPVALTGNGVDFSRALTPAPSSGATIAAAGVWLRRRRSMLPRLAAGLIAFGFLASAGLGCSGKSPARNASPTDSGTYTYTVSATDGTVTHTATYSLTVTIR